MAKLGTSVKTVFLKGLEALGKTASNLSDTAQHKLNVMNLENRRSEVLEELPKCVLQLWKDGAELPEALASLLTELNDVEQKLTALRPQPEPKPQKAEKPAAEEPVAEIAEIAEVAEETAEEVVEAPAEETVEEEAAEPVVEVAEETAEEN